MASKKPSIVSMARGGIYAASIIMPAKTAYDQLLAGPAGGDKMKAAEMTLKCFGGINASTGQFDWEVIKQMYTPVVAWTVIDTIASKTGVWKRMGKLIGNLNLMG